MGLTEVGLSFVAAGFLEIAYPVALALYIRRRLRVSWSVFYVGCAMFLASLARIPLNNYGSLLIMGADLGQATMILLTALPSLTAGVFEEGARYVAYRFVVKEHTLKNGFMYGAGHGGIESIFLVGINVLTIGFLVLTNPSTFPAWQLAGIEETPLYLPFVGLYERVMAIAIQIGLSVMVLESFRRKNPGYLAAAVLIHFVVDFTVLTIVNYGVLYAELMTTGFALGLGYWSLERLRDEKLEGVGPTVA